MCNLAQTILACDARIANNEDCVWILYQKVWKLQQVDLHDKFWETFTGEIYDNSGK